MTKENLDNKIFVATFKYSDVTEKSMYKTAHEAKEYLKDMAFIYFTDLLDKHSIHSSFEHIASYLQEHDITLDVSIDFDEIEYVQVCYDENLKEEDIRYDERNRHTVKSFFTWVNNKLIKLCGTLDKDIPKNIVESFKFASKEGVHFWVKYKTKQPRITV